MYTMKLTISTLIERDSNPQLHLFTMEQNSIDATVEILFEPGENSVQLLNFLRFRLSESGLVQEIFIRNLVPEEFSALTEPVNRLVTKMMESQEPSLYSTRGAAGPSP